MELKHQNRTYLIGNCGGDAETRMAGSSKLVTVRLAVSDDYKQGEEWVKRDPIWIDCEFWGQAEDAAESLKKGTRISLSGKLKFETWEDKNTGQKRSKHKINVYEFEVEPKRPSAEAEPATQNTPQETAKPKGKKKAAAAVASQDDGSQIPF